MQNCQSDKHKALPQSWRPPEVVEVVEVILVPLIAFAASKLNADHDGGVSVYTAKSELLGFDTRYIIHGMDNEFASDAVLEMICA